MYLKNPLPMPRHTTKRSTPFTRKPGIPIYYNDTIGKETRVSHGQEVTYYETLKIAYTLEGYSFYMEFDFYTKEEIATLRSMNLST